MRQILLLMDHQENRALLAEWLAGRYQVTLADAEQALDEPFDLGVLDGPALDRLWERLQARKLREQPVFLPVLLVTSRQDVGLATRQLWRSIDELIITPIERAELQARVEVLLRAREISLELERRAEESRRLLAALELRAAELDATFGAMADGLIVYDPMGRTLRMNPEAQSILGYAPGERDLTLVERIARWRVETPEGEEWPLEQLPAARALRGETIRGATMVVHRPSAEGLWLSVNAAPMRAPDGQVLGAVMTFRDITALHRLQEERDHYVHTISHDLRAPLTIIAGQAQVLLRVWQEASFPDRYRRNAEAVVVAARQMNLMIQDLIDSARLGSGQLRLAKQPATLQAFMGSLLERATGALDAERVRLDIPPDLPPVDADPDRLERIFTNLLSNALKFSPPDRPVLVTAKRVGDEVVASVIDRGVGIAPAEVPRLFQRFYRATSGGKREGLGLGLYITKMLVEAHGGRIWADSELGQGSAFHVALPLVRSGAQPAA